MDTQQLDSPLEVNSKFLGQVIGKYTGFHRAFRANRLTMPKFSRLPCVHFDAVSTNLLFAFFSNRGAFYGPTITSVVPRESEIADQRELTTSPILFSEGFVVENALLIDSKHQQIIAPLDFEIAEILAGDHAQFVFKFKWAIR